jgi:hypothetical protein
MDPRKARCIMLLLPVLREHKIYRTNLNLDTLVTNNGMDDDRFYCWKFMELQLFRQMSRDGWQGRLVYVRIQPHHIQ